MNIRAVGTATLVAWIAWSVSGTAGATPCPPGQVSLAGGDSAATSCASGNASADWQARISAGGVVWYHNFDTASEVNQFRWTGGKGNDPNGTGTDGQYVTWQSSGGADGGPYMRLSYPVGAAHGNSYWGRPFAPLNGAGNGRGTNDPGDGGRIPVQPFPVSDGSSTLYNWQNSATNQAWYGHSSYNSAYPTEFQGTDFYVQVRVRRAQTPGRPPNSAQYSGITGKFVWLTTTSASYTPQELVTNGQNQLDQVGVRSYPNTYLGSNFQDVGHQGGTPAARNSTSIQTGSEISGTCDPYNSSVGGCWQYSGGWDTLLLHVTPGRAGVSETRFEMWAQRDLTLGGVPGVYQKIWDVSNFPVTYATGSDSVGGVFRPGYNCLLLAIYHNGSAFNTSTFNFDYDQVIFSKRMIAAPGS